MTIPSRIKNIPLEKLTLFAILIIGAFYLFVFPPNSAPDEAVHFAAAYQNADVLLGQTSADVKSFALRAADVKMITEYSNFPDHYTYEFFHGELWKPLPEGGANIVEIKRESGVPHPYIYFPQTAGILLGRALCANPEWLYLFGRIFNLIFYAVCVWLAVKLTPIGKGVFAVTALFPMAMELAASFNSDVYSTALAFLAAAQYLRIAYADAPARWRDLLLMLLTMGLLAPPKVVFLPFLMLAFCLPKTCLRGKNKSKLFLYPILAALVFLAALIFALTIYLHRADGGIPVVTYADQAVYTPADLIANPLLFAKLCWHTLQIYLGFYFGSLIGTDLGWLEIPIPDVLILAFLAFAILGAFKNSATEKSLLRRDRVEFPAIFLLAALGTAIIMFVSWTPLDSWNIVGLQGRYFLPVFPLLILFAARWRKPTRPEWLSDKTLLLLTCVLQAVVLVCAYTFIAGRSTVVL